MNNLKFYTFATLAILEVSCGDDSKMRNLNLDNIEKQKLIENQQKQITQLETRLNDLEARNQSGSDRNDNLYIGTSQFYFIVLEVVENHLEPRKMYYTTQVNQIADYNENLKYQLLDQVVTNYKNSPSGRVYEGSIKNRNIHLFDTYEKASRSREKYIMN